MAVAYFDPENPDVKGPNGNVSWSLTNVGMGKQVSPVPPPKVIPTINEEDGSNKYDGGAVIDDNGLVWLPADNGGVSANHTLKGRTTAYDWVSAFDAVDVYYTVVADNDGNAKVCHWSPTVSIPMADKKHWMILEVEALIEAKIGHKCTRYHLVYDETPIRLFECK